MAEPKHGTAPIGIDETPGKKAYCQCGLSAKLPYCDGSHSREGTGLAPLVVEVETAGRKAVCQCHQSGNKPWCDGTHGRLAGS
ncbi:MAG: CDGSH iron-sulfur domain-containing protein [Planctomycetes bacterium]|nr:CDGSH iron-sulfur domain-containing protein [Planctomycetota bacterium]